MRRGRRANKMRKILYLARHPELLDWSGEEIVKALKFAGLVAKGTWWKDVNPAELVEAAEELRAVKVSEDDDDGSIERRSYAQAGGK